MLCLVIMEKQKRKKKKKKKEEKNVIAQIPPEKKKKKKKKTKKKFRGFVWREGGGRSGQVRLSALALDLTAPRSPRPDVPASGGILIQKKKKRKKKFHQACQLTEWREVLLQV